MILSEFLIDISHEKADVKRKITPLREVDELAQQIRDDLNIIENKGRQGIESARPVVKTLWEIEQDNDGKSTDDKEEVENESEKDGNVTTGGSKNSSKNIGSLIDESDVSVSAVLNRLSTDEGTELWTNQPIVNKDSGSPHPEWSLKKYGKVLCQTAFEHDDELDWLYRFAIGPEEISLYERQLVVNTLDEFGFIDN